MRRQADRQTDREIKSGQVGGEREVGDGKNDSRWKVEDGRSLG